MTEDNGTLHGPVSRRDFLALASSTLALTLTAYPESQAFAADQPSEANRLDTGGIAMEYFGAARKRATAMVSRLTLKEKISQFGTQAPAIKRLGMPAFNYYASEALHGLIHDGPVTSFPLPLALGCSWNRSLMKQIFTVASDEVWAWHKKSGMDLAMFSPPTVNMGSRDPRWGRIAENYSEDPYLVGQLAIQVIHGMQGEDPRYLKTIACAKHFITNDTDSDREYTSATVDPRSFWEYYSRGFEACVKEGHVFTVMSSYNAMNGVPTTCSQFLLTEVLRNRWGFRGYVASDCDAVGDICRTHHFVPDYAEASALAVNAGCDINCGRTLQMNLGEAVDRMLISESALDHSLIRSFTGRILLGEFDPPEQVPYSKIPVSCLGSPAHRQMALEAARQSIVLFKNEQNTLPLDRNSVKKIAVIGPMADICFLGNYSGTPIFRVSPLQGIRNYLGIPDTPSRYRMRAGDFTQMKGPLRLMPCSEGGEEVQYNNGSSTAYSNIQLTGVTEFHARVASAPGGGALEVHLDSLDGPLLCQLKIPNTGGWQTWIDVSAPVASTKGQHTVYLLSSGPSGHSFSVQSFHLTPAPPASDPAQGSTQIVHARGCTVLGDRDSTLFAEAIKAAAEADVVLVFLGCDQQVDQEGKDRSYIHLPGVQDELLHAIYEANHRTILVISSNAPVSVNWAQDYLPAIVGGLFLGEQQGRALADVIFGDYNPGGKLSTTWFQGVEDLPDFHDYDIRHGRTYMYFTGKPLYPFGHGLSYTSFEYRNLRTSSHTLSPGGKITLNVDVVNTGNRDGDEIVQLYIHVNGKSGTVVRPIQQLVNFDRVHLRRGQTRTVSFDLFYEEPALHYWDETSYEFVVEPATLDLMVGASSADIRLKGQIQLTAGTATSDT